MFIIDYTFLSYPCPCPLCLSLLSLRHSRCILGSHVQLGGPKPEHLLPHRNPPAERHQLREHPGDPHGRSRSVHRAHREQVSAAECEWVVQRQTSFLVKGYPPRFPRLSLLNPSVAISVTVSAASSSGSPSRWGLGRIWGRRNRAPRMAGRSPGPAWT